MTQFPHHLNLFFSVVALSFVVGLNVQVSFVKVSALWTLVYLRHMDTSATPSDIGAAELQVWMLILLRDSRLNDFVLVVIHLEVT